MSRRKQTKPRHVDAVDGPGGNLVAGEETPVHILQGIKETPVPDLANPESISESGDAVVPDDCKVSDDNATSPSSPDSAKSYGESPLMMERTNVLLNGHMSSGEDKSPAPQSQDTMDTSIRNVDTNSDNCSSSPLRDNVEDRSDDKEPVKRVDGTQNEVRDHDPSNMQIEQFNPDEDDDDDMFDEDGEEEDEEGMDDDCEMTQNGLLPNSNVMLQTLATTRVAVAQIAENNMAALEGSPSLQQTLLSLQQQQFLQLQLLHQLQHQLYQFMGADAAVSMFSVSPPTSSNNPSQPSTSESSPYISVSPPPPVNKGLNDSSNSLANLAKLANGPDPSDVMGSKTSGGEGLVRNTSSSSLSKGGGKPNGQPSSSMGTMLDRSQYAADDPFYRHKCRFCHKVFGSDSALQIHVRSHTGEKPYKCNVCGSRFSTKGNYKVHFERHKAEFPHVEMDDHLYLDEKPLVPGPPELLKETLPLLPPTSQTKSPPGMPSLMKSDTLTEKPGHHDIPSILTPNMPSPAKLFPGERAFMAPMPGPPPFLNRSPTPGAPFPLPPTVLGAPMPDLPPFADMPLFRGPPPPVKRDEEDDMEQFMEIDQSETGKLEALVKGIEDKLTDPNQCVVCKRILSCKSSLQMHYRTHTGERPFKCKICSRAFTTKGNLKTHMGVHRSKPPLRMMHQCPVCHKQFTNGLVLQQHMRMHATSDGIKNFFPPPLLPPIGPFPLPFPGLPFPMPPNFGLPGFPTNGLDLSKHSDDMDNNEEDDEDIESDGYDENEDSYDILQTEQNEKDDLNENVFEESLIEKSPIHKLNESKNSDKDESVEENEQTNSASKLPMPNISLSLPYLNQPGVITSVPSSYSTSLSALENSVKAIDNFMAPKFPGFPFPDALQNAESRCSSEIPSDRGTPQERNSPREASTAGRILASPALSETNSSICSANRMNTGETRDMEEPTHNHSPFSFNPFAFHGLLPKGIDKHDNRSRPALDIHMRSHPKERPFFCRVCDRSFSSAGNMKQHMLTHKIKDLPLGFEGNQAMQSGQNSPSSDSENKDVSPLSGITPPCISSTLPPSSGSAQSQASPMSSPSAPNPLPQGLAPTSLASRPPQTSGPSPLPPTFKSIPPTIPNAPPPPDSSPFVRRHNPKHTCQVCQKPFSGGSALQIHMRTHTGEKPFKCEVCGKAFTTKGNLKVHMGTHMVQNGPSRRGRRMSMEGIPGFPPPGGPKDVGPDRPGFNPFAHRAPSDLYPGFPFTVFPNGLFPPMKGMPPFPLPPTSGPMLKGPPPGLPHDGLMKPRHPGLSPDMLMKAEEMIKSHHQLGEKKDSFENNNITSKGNSGELDLSIRKPSPAIST